MGKCVKNLWKKRLCLFLILFGVVVFVSVSGYVLSPEIVIRYKGRERHVRTYQTQGEMILQEAEIALGPYDTWKMEENVLTVFRAYPVTVRIEGKEQTVYTQNETVGNLLQRLNIVQTPDMRISPDTEDKTCENMVISVDRITIGQETLIRDVPYETLYCRDPSLPAGCEEIIFEGKPGLCSVQVEATYVNGKRESIQVLSSAQTQEPKPQIIAVGTGEGEGQPRNFPLLGEGLLITEQGQCLYYSYADTYEATAYTAWIEDVTGTTACGTPARVGAVAVDPKVIPYFTKMYIVSEDGVFDYGIASAEDCGGAVKGKIIDLYFDTLEQCCEFGRRDITVYFLQ